MHTIRIHLRTRLRITLHSFGYSYTLANARHAIVWTRDFLAGRAARPGGPSRGTTDFSAHLLRGEARLLRGDLLARLPGEDLDLVGGGVGGGGGSGGEQAEGVFRGGEGDVGQHGLAAPPHPQAAVCDTETHDCLNYREKIRSTKLLLFFFFFFYS